MSGMLCAPPKCTARILGSRRRLSLGCCACRRWRTIDVGGVAVAQRGVRSKFMFGQEIQGHQSGPRWHDEIDERSVNFNRHFIEA